MVAATYAVPGSCAEGSIALICDHSGRMSFGGVTLVQVFPPSRVRWINPSSDPTQIKPFVIGDSLMVKIVS